MIRALTWICGGGLIGLLISAAAHAYGVWTVVLALALGLVLVLALMYAAERWRAPTP